MNLKFKNVCSLLLKFGKGVTFLKGHILTLVNDTLPAKRVLTFKYCLL